MSEFNKEEGPTPETTDVLNRVNKNAKKGAQKLVNYYKGIPKIGSLRERTTPREGEMRALTVTAKFGYTLTIETNQCQKRGRRLSKLER